MTRFVLIALTAAACQSSSLQASEPTSEQSEPVVAEGASPPERGVRFTGMCDASGAVALDAYRFAVADDEDNLIRVYDARNGGPPTQIFVLDFASEEDELDLEAATRIDDKAVWLASHSRSKGGEPMPMRQYVFASTLPDAEGKLRILGSPSELLLQTLTSEPRLAHLELANAAELSPIRRGGLNIEGMTARPEGGVIVGFRSPVPEGRALIVGISNPLELAQGFEPPRFDTVHQLDLGEGRGIRGISQWHGRYLLIGGSPTRTIASKLFSWDGSSDHASAIDVDLRGYNPEAFFTPEDSELIMVLSDDGEVDRGGTRCKRLRDAKKKSFRGIWLELDRYKK